MADIISYPLGTPAADTLLVGTQMNVQQLDGGEANLTRNFTLSNVASLINTGFAGGYKVYTALLTQAGVVNPPVATIMQNTTGGTITLSRTSTGAYAFVISGATYTENKTTIFLGNTNATNNIAAVVKSTTDITFEQKDLANSNVDGLTKISIEIRIYS